MSHVPTLIFVDERGGALASLGASLAVHRGMSARAEARGRLEERPEVWAVLEEIGVENRVVPSKTHAHSANEFVVTLSDRETATIAVSLYDGPAETAFGPTHLERAALARISRDRIERWLDQQGRGR